MDFIERLLGFAPDNGDGSVEIGQAGVEAVEAVRDAVVLERDHAVAFARLARLALSLDLVERRIDLFGEGAAAFHFAQPVTPDTGEKGETAG